MGLFSGEKSRASPDGADWYSDYYRGNEKYFRSGSLLKTIDWSNSRHIQFGALSLAGLDDAISCIAAGDQTMASRWLDESHIIVERCRELVGTLPSEEMAFDIIQIAIARSVESLLHHNRLQSLNVPSNVLEAHLGSSDGAVDLFCGVFLWDLCAMFDLHQESHENASAQVPVRKPKTLVPEASLLEHASCMFDTSCDDVFWNEFGTVARRWRRPNQWLKTEASIYQHPVSYLLALIWAKNRTPPSTTRDGFISFLLGRAEPVS